MKILMVNKFLYTNGGSETYILKLGDYLKYLGHEVQYFGMNHKDRLVGNKIGSYTSNIDFHSGTVQKILYLFKIIYSFEARKKIRIVLDDFQPDVIHLNNFNYQITPSIIYEVLSYRKHNKKTVKIVYTAHDYQLICPNHMLNNPNSHLNCEKCIGGSFIHCFLGRCIHTSAIKSALGSIEGYLYKILKTYKYIDKVICPTHFIENMMKTNKLFINKTEILYNFIDVVEQKHVLKKDYVLYFGRLSEEKGIKTLVEACRKLPDIQFIFAGSGPLSNDFIGIKNIKNVGFQTGSALEELIRNARYSIYPSEWYENCPFSVMESQMYGTPVIGADIGGIPELIIAGYTGELFKSGDAKELGEIIEKLWNDRKKTADYSENCRFIRFDNIEEYCTKLILLYKG